MPEIARDLHVSSGWGAGAMLVAFHALAWFVETPLLAWSERVRVRWFSAGALAAVALSSLCAAMATGPWMLLVALALYGPASGCALASAEGALVQRGSMHRDRLLARLGLSASIGDLAVPALLALLAALGLGWRAAFVVCAATAATLAVVHARSRELDRFPGNDDEEEEASSPWFEGVRIALHSRGLMVWSIACALTGLLDEVLVAFVALHLHALGANAFVRSAAIAAWTLGSIAGLALLERVAGRVDGRRLLFAGSVFTIAAMIVLATAHAPIVASAAFGAVGFFAASLHPLTKSRAYASLPGRPAIVNAVASALLPVEMASPVVLGLIVAQAGSRAAVAALLVAPVGIVLASMRRE